MFEDLLIECGKWVLITMGVLVGLWILYQMTIRLELTELVKRQTLKSPVPMLAALGVGAAVIVFVLIIKLVVAHLHEGEVPQVQVSPAEEALHPKN